MVSTEQLVLAVLSSIALTLALVYFALSWASCQAQFWLILMIEAHKSFPDIYHSICPAEQNHVEENSQQSKSSSKEFEETSR